MSRESLIILFGFIVLITPFLGLPRNLKGVLLVASGAIIMSIGFLFRRAAFLHSIENGFGERHDETFVEPTPVDVSQNQEPVDVENTV